MRNDYGHSPSHAGQVLLKQVEDDRRTLRILYREGHTALRAENLEEYITGLVAIRHMDHHEVRRELAKVNQAR